MSKRDQLQICREEWFKDHKAERIVHYQCGEKGDAIIIEWKRPDSWNYGCRFIVHSQWLIVVGDLGEAAYQWGQRITLEFLAGLNFDYFHGKCRAAPSGRKFQQWDPRKALDRIKGLRHAPDPKHRDFGYSTEGQDEQEFKGLLHVAVNDGIIDYDLAAELSECGLVPDPMSVGHFVGLQMAIKQITTPATIITP